MGLIEDMFEAMSGGHAATHPELAQAMVALTGDAQSPGIGIDGLLQRLNAVGLGGTARSWDGEGQRQPLSPGDLHRALGEATVHELAARAGLAPDDLIGTLSTHLPGVIAQLRAKGHLSSAVSPQS